MVSVVPNTEVAFFPFFQVFFLGGGRARGAGGWKYFSFLLLLAVKFKQHYFSNLLNNVRKRKKENLKNVSTKSLHICTQKSYSDADGDHKCRGSRDGVELILISGSVSPLNWKGHGCKGTDVKGDKGVNAMSLPHFSVAGT